MQPGLERQPLVGEPAALTEGRVQAAEVVDAEHAVLDEPLVQRPVFRTIQQRRARRLPIPPGSARFLVIRLQRAGDGVVRDHSHVGAVDAHAERVGRDHDPRAAAHELVLRLLARIGRHPAVVEPGRGLYDLGDEPRHLLRIATCPHVNNRGAAIERLQRLQQRAELAGRVAAVLDVKGEVRPIEPGDDVGDIIEPEQPRDVGPDPGGSGGGEGGGEGIAHARPRRGDVEVVGAKIVAPLRDAVRFVNGQQRYVHLRERALEGGAAEPLGGDVDQPIVARLHRRQSGELLGARDRAVDEGRGDADALQ